MHDPHQKLFDSLAAEWDLIYTAEDLERLSYIVDGIGVDKGMHVLDIGCSTGVLFDMIRRKVGDKGSVTGVDFSFEMVQRALRNFPFKNVNVVDGDALNMPFPDSTFDMAVSFSAFPHFANQQRAIDEAHRVLKSGAKLYVIHLHSSKGVTDHHHEAGGILEHDQLPPAQKMQKMLDASKFSDIKVVDQHGRYIASGVNQK